MRYTVIDKSNLMDLTIATSVKFPIVETMFWTIKFNYNLAT